MRKILLLFSLIGTAAAAQQHITLTLPECYERVVEVYPVRGDKTLLEGMTALRLKNHSAAWYPKFDLYAQATYQSDVVNLDLNLPLPGIEIPQPTKDQYKVAMDISQVIYDGGTARKRKELEEQQLETSLQMTEVTLYQLKTSVNTFFFTILLLQEQEKILHLVSGVLDERIKVAGSAVGHGVLLRSDLLVLQAERLKLEQQLTETLAARRSALDAFGKLLEMDLDRDVILDHPEPGLIPQEGINRPEVHLYESRIAQAEISGGLLKTSRLPKLYAFGQLGYGRPGLNMLDDAFDSWYLVGARISWNPFDWKVNQRERQVITLQQEQVRNQLEAFSLGMEMELERSVSDILKYEELIRSDDELIGLRSAITRTSTAQFDNGVINSSDLLADLNEEKQARINREIHRIRLLQARAEYLVISGN